MNKVCEVCGSEIRVGNTRFGILCHKHYLQMYRHGKIRRTIYDPNKIIIDGDMTKIELYDTKGNVTGYSIIDTEDIHKIEGYKFYARKGYTMGSKKGKKKFLHRIITDCPEGLFVDHIYGTTNDNRKYNLRICTKSQNSKNMRKGHIAGITKVPSGNYQAGITVNYKFIYLGTFPNREEAENARVEAEIKYYGEFSPNNR